MSRQSFGKSGHRSPGDSFRGVATRVLILLPLGSVVFAAALLSTITMAGCGYDVFTIVSPGVGSTVQSPVHLEVTWGHRSHPGPKVTLDGTDISSKVTIDRNDYKLFGDIPVAMGTHKFDVSGLLYPDQQQRIEWNFEVR